jgi:hypothetical protein
MSVLDSLSWRRVANRDPYFRPVQHVISCTSNSAFNGAINKIVLISPNEARLLGSDIISR